MTKKEINNSAFISFLEEFGLDVINTSNPRGNKLNIKKNGSLLRSIYLPASGSIDPRMAVYHFQSICNEMTNFFGEKDPEVRDLKIKVDRLVCRLNEIP